LLNAAGNPFTTFYGMEWGTISGGGHVLVYGFKDSLINWETGNLDILVPKSDYITLFDTIRRRAGAFATLAHPNNSDFTGLTGGYKGVADSAVVSVAIESGPAFSTNTTYSEYPSSLAYISYYRNLLRQGYRVAAHMDQDNHEMTFGTANGNRMVVLAKERSRAAIVSGIKAMRVYASNDYNAQVSFTMNSFIMGSSIRNGDNLIGVVSHTDADGEGLSAVQVYGGRVGGSDATLIHSALTNTSFTTAQATGETWYYYAIITQGDGNKIITAPIWLTRAAEIPLPIKVLDPRAVLAAGKTELTWKTGEELNASHFIVERSTDGSTYVDLGKVSVRGSGSSYSFRDALPASGVNYYRLRLVDVDGSFEYSKIVSVSLKEQAQFTIAPNPASSVVTIRRKVTGNQQVLVQLIDAAGNRVYNKSHSGSATINISVAAYPAGVYVIRVGDALQTLVVQK